MRATFVLLKSSSSGRWLSRQQADPYVRSRGGGMGTGAGAGAGAYRARSSFKLLELAERYPILARGGVVVDLGAAPGGWAQVAAGRVGVGLRGRGRVIALDLLGMDPIAGVDVWTGDFLDPAVRARLAADVGKVDTVLSDMMAPMSGVRARDVQASLDLVGAAATFARCVLRPGVVEGAEGGEASGSRSAMGDGAVSSEAHGGSFVVKFFMHPDLLAFRKRELDPFFRRIVTDKPKASRAESSEAYWVCMGFRGP
ncbi:2' O-ribose methyltransferase [Cryptotrichosporon argae]